MRRVGFLLLLAACDRLVDGDYPGEPIHSLAGTVVVPLAADADALRGLALLWQDPEDDGGPGAAVSRVAIELAFPFDFRLDLTAGPPSQVRFRLAPGEPLLGEAYVYALRTESGPYDLADVVGIDQEHAIVWAEDDVPEGTLSAEYLGGAMAAGYHLRDFVPSEALSATQALLAERCPEPSRCAAIRHYQLVPPRGGERLRVTLGAPQ